MTVSVVIPAHNSAAYLPETVGRLLPQLGSDDEIILVDDGSKDDTKAVVEGLGDSRISYLWLENSGGPARPRNIGCRAAKGEYLFLVDADDLAEPGKIASAVAALQNHPDAAFLFANFNMVDEHGELMEEFYLGRYHTLAGVLGNSVGEDLYKIDGGVLLESLLKANFIGTSSVAMRRSAWAKTDGFREELSNLDDRDMWLQLCRQGHGLFLDRVSYSYRNRPGSISKIGLRHQLLERVGVGKQVKSWDLSPRQRRAANRFIGKSYLKLGYLDFHELDDKSSAFRWFTRSLFLHPTFAALRGAVKSLLPTWLYLMLRGKKRPASLDSYQE